MKKVTYLLVSGLAVLMTAFRLQAQCINPAQIDSTYLPADATGTDQALVKAMDLTPLEAQAFLPIFHQYEAERIGLKKKFVTLQIDFQVEEQNRLTDDEAWLGVDEIINFQLANVYLQKKYAKLIRKVLLPKQARLFFVLENDLRRQLQEDTETEHELSVKGAR